MALNLEEILEELQNVSPESIERQIAEHEAKIKRLKTIQKLFLKINAVAGPTSGRRGSNPLPTEQDDLDKIATAMGALGPATCIEISRNCSIQHKRVERLLTILHSQGRAEMRGEKWKLRG